MNSCYFLPSMDLVFLDRLLNQIRLFKLIGSKKRFLKRHIDTRTTPGGIREGKFWLNKVHAYFDNKKFVCPRNAKERKLLRAAMVRHHLRTASQGKDPMFILPNTQRMLQG